MASTAPSRPGGKQVRTRQRAAHLITGVLVLIAVYAGPLLGPVFAAVVQWVAFPLLVLSGLAMWQWPRIRRVLRGRAGAAAR
jgi:hypothetical protein